MTADHRHDSGARDTWTIWPILYLDARWSESCYDCFDLGAKLIRADSDTLARMKSIVGGWSPRWPGDNVFDSDVGWILAVALPRADVLPSFRRALERFVVETFLLALRLCQSTPAICPVDFRASSGGSGIAPESIEDCDDYQIADYDMPPCDCPETFGEGDLPRLVQTWSGLVEVRRMRSWQREPALDSLFRKLQERGEQQVNKKLRRLLRGGVSEMPKDEQDQLVNSLKATGQFDSIRDEAFADQLARHMEHEAGGQTRIGRALALFDNGLHLPPLHSFLSMCLCLETLFTHERYELSHRLAVRMARLLSLGEENSEDGREAIYERVKDVYGERSSLVHGSKRVDKVSPEIRKDAFDLTRACLQRIVCDPNLARLYSDERIKMGGKDTKLIDFYRKLDLGLDVEW